MGALFVFDRGMEQPKEDKKEKRRALICGITGQDGSYLAEFLLSKNYEVHGIIRRSSSFNTQRLNDIYVDMHDQDYFKLHFGDLTDGTALRRVMEQVKPHEVYNLAAQSHVKVSFLEPEYTADVVALGALRLLDVVRDVEINLPYKIRLYQAGSSEMFGSTPPPQNEDTPFHPRSPYAVSKVSAHWYGINYREAYGMFVCNGILNHESPRRGETFVTRKITRAATRIKMGLQSKLYLGNLDAKRDWGFAGDYVQGMWLMLQHDKPDDYVISTGESHSVREFLDVAFGRLGLKWEDYVVIDPNYYRPTEVDWLQGDCTKAKEVLKWEVKTTFKALVEMMVDADLELAKEEHLVKQAKDKQKGNGHDVKNKTEN